MAIEWFIVALDVSKAMWVAKNGTWSKESNQPWANVISWIKNCKSRSIWLSLINCPSRKCLEKENYLLRHQTPYRNILSESLLTIHLSKKCAVIRNIVLSCTAKLIQQAFDCMFSSLITSLGESVHHAIPPASVSHLIRCPYWGSKLPGTNPTIVFKYLYAASVDVSSRCTITISCKVG